MKKRTFCKMAEVCKEISEDLLKEFNNASMYVKSIVSSLSNQEVLEFYGLFKQATEGLCARPKPSWYKLTEVQKWEAWSALEDLDSSEAMKLYICKLNSLVPEWKGKPVQKSLDNWVHHSCMQNHEDEIKDSHKTIFDWVKEKNYEQVLSKGSTIGSEINKLDDNGLSLLHWASDRGSVEIVKYIIEHLHADINVKDSNGQTPLHYAVSCDHGDVVTYLIEAGADINLTDNDGNTPYDTD